MPELNNLIAFAVLPHTLVGQQGSASEMCSMSIYQGFWAFIYFGKK
jgi:hypothetical protein